MCSNTFTAVRVLMGTSYVISTGTVRKKANVKLRYVGVTVNKSRECLPSGMGDLDLDQNLRLSCGHCLLSKLSSQNKTKTFLLESVVLLYFNVSFFFFFFPSCLILCTTDLENFPILSKPCTGSLR